MKQLLTVLFILVLLGNSAILTSYAQQAKLPPPPLEQYKSGIFVNHIRCNSDELQLIFKNEDGSPACVIYNTAVELIQRGWGSWNYLAKTPYYIAQNGTTGKISVDGSSVVLSYTITNGNLTDAKVVKNSQAIVLAITSNSDGEMTITIPRSLIDPKRANGADDWPIILNDGMENNQFGVIATTKTDRTLLIPFIHGTHQIEVIGAFLI